MLKRKLRSEMRLLNTLQAAARVFLALFALPLTHLAVLPPVTSASLELALFTLGLLRSAVEEAVAQGELGDSKKMKNRRGMQNVIEELFAMSSCLETADALLGGLLARHPFSKA